MKGLMVSLIIVFFAGMTSTVVSAGQQAEQDAAGFRSRFGLQPIAAPPERPGPDDSDDDVAWPTPNSLSRGSTNTSSLGDRQFGRPAPESARDDNIRFDVKVDQNAIEMLRKGLKVYSQVDVRDQSTKAALDPGVVSDIALFLDANAGKDLTGVELFPQPMEAGSSTLKFEIQEQQLGRIEKDAFLFKVPSELRGKFDRVEFVAVSGPSGSHEFSTGLSGGPRGTALGFGGAGQAERFGGNPVRRFDGADTTPWNTAAPQPGPAPGEPQFTGPFIDPVELEARRNRVVPLDTGDRFRLAERVPQVDPNRSPFGLARQQSGVNQNNRDQNTFGQNRNDFQQNAIAQPTTGQPNQESFAAQQLRLTQQKLAQAEADREALLRNNNDWKQEVDRLAQERDSYGRQLQLVADRDRAVQPVGQRPFVADRSYLDRTASAAQSLVTPFGSRPEDFQTRGTDSTRLTKTELDQQRIINQMEIQLDLEKSKGRRLQREKQTAEFNLNNAQELLLDRNTTYEGGFQQTSFNPNAPNESQNRGNGRNPDGSVRVANAGVGNGGRNRGAASYPAAHEGQPGTEAGGGIDEPQKSGKGSPDLIWLLPLLLGSVALNVFLWVHSRSLHMRYEELADELRGMVGASTI